ncbi:acyltransferase family protein [Hoeflea ulvae]|uniref:Acyltransferase n=1 Tax=Hoeflea ulvae TaxID=2983764 RepID=A0ABT3YFF3_9HYPH|nr:acyltransferase [Hoeflea ulvae]MCY0094625.1 acyltransferase [Hoeflea ulvae]
MSGPGFSSQPDAALLSVQYLRAAAALVVMFFHVSVLTQETWGLDPERVDHVGAAGVDLFFVISGFIMAMIVARQGAFDGKDFWIRRIARIVPAYWVITFFVFALAALLPSLFQTTTAELLHLLLSLSFLAVDSGDGSTVPMLGVGWTLNYEMFFYAIVALTAGLFADRRLLGTSGVIIALVLAGVLIDPANPTLAFYTNPILLEFVFGVFVFRIWLRARSRKVGLAPLVVLVAGVLLLVWQWERPLVDWRPYYWGLPATAVLYGALQVVTFKSAFLARLGDWSYALYLTHVFVVTFYIKFVVPLRVLGDMPWEIHYLVMTILAFGVAAGFYTLVERPLSRWVLNRLRPATPEPQRAAATGPAE